MYFFFLEIFCKGEVFKKIANCYTIFHDSDTVFVAERSCIRIRLRRQLFVDYLVPVDSVDEKASNITLVHKFHGD